MSPRKVIAGHTVGVWLLWALGVLVLVSAPMAIADPGIWMLVLDPELLALMIAVAIAALRVGLGLYAARLRDLLWRKPATGRENSPCRR